MFAIYVWFSLECSTVCYLSLHFFSCELLIIIRLQRSFPLILCILLQVLAYAQQSRERANKEQASLVERMHEYKRQIDRESRSSVNGLNDCHNGDGIQTIGRSSHKMIEAVMQSSSKGKVRVRHYDSWERKAGNINLKRNLMLSVQFSGSDHSSRLSLKEIFELERRLEKKILCT